jgi:hypothetical protein
MGTMHSAKLHKSARLQRVYNLLLDGKEHTTRDIIQSCTVCSVSSIVSELRRNNIDITCRFIERTKGAAVYGYTLGVEEG